MCQLLGGQAKDTKADTVGSWASPSFWEGSVVFMKHVCTCWSLMYNVGF